MRLDAFPLDLVFLIAIKRTQLASLRLWSRNAPLLVGLHFCSKLLIHKGPVEHLEQITVSCLGNFAQKTSTTYNVCIKKDVSRKTYVNEVPPISTKRLVADPEKTFWTCCLSILFPPES